jgi:hypothetical protein
MDNVKFAKAMRESGLVDKKLQLSSVAVIFLSVKQPVRAHRLLHDTSLNAAARHHVRARAWVGCVWAHGVPVRQGAVKGARQREPPHAPLSHAALA